MKAATRLAGKKDFHYVGKIAKLILKEAKASEMCHQSEEEIKTSIKNGYSVLVFAGKKLAGYCHLEIWENYTEISSSVVFPEFRNQGIGTKLKKACLNLALKLFPDKEVITLSHGASVKTSSRIGFVKKPKNEFRAELWELCKKCEEYGNFPNCRCQGMIYQK